MLYINCKKETHMELLSPIKKIKICSNLYESNVRYRIKYRVR